MIPMNSLLPTFRMKQERILVSRKKIFEVDKNSSEWEKYKLGETVPGEIIDMLPINGVNQSIMSRYLVF